MQLLEEKILKCAKVLPGNILKVDGFLNHQIDISLMCEIGKEFKRIFNDCEVTKILTIEASGIGVACVTAQFFNCPVVFAKKNRTAKSAGGVYSAAVHSFTHDRDYEVFVSKEFISKKDKVLVIDDFLANGQAIEGLAELINQAGAELLGAGLVIEKGFQGGGDMLRQRGIRIESLAVIDKMDGNDIKFRSGCIQ